ncbi:hypothetical protein HN51_063020 [Arachis hypogaea]|uniref:Uncharacterized protein n=1 Tax=Arachis hypogaea TaxID=3818 RepID=A0A445AZU3_ARAHY|nr:uncharacterized protein LOC107618984 [Arachis ipaensis]XP_025631125.1 protein EMBRYO DEFECTIVE 514-like [Arachis hypogaea]QHO20583.1 uncharacterized protein DS421_11g339190 [Arachis hypogaea]RYR31938.1 hypothetical protein Ahy_B01g056885 [Arachis hypogaea]
MAETTAPEEQLPEKNTSSSSSSSSAEEMDVDSPKPEDKADDKSKQSRGLEEDDKVQSGDDKPTDSKKQKVDDRKGKAKVDEQSEDKKEKKKKKEEANKDIPTGPVKLSYRTFDSSVDMYDYFYNFLHTWPLNLNVNKYEHEMLLELVKKGDKHAVRKIGGGVRSFQVRMHPTWMGRCFFLIREDESVEDFCFRKCVDTILPLPDEMLPQPGVDTYLRSRSKYSKQGGPAAAGSGN